MRSITTEVCYDNFACSHKSKYLLHIVLFLNPLFDVLYHYTPIRLVDMHRRRHDIYPSANRPRDRKCISNIVSPLRVSGFHVTRGHELGHDEGIDARWCGAPLPRCVMIIILFSNTSLTVPCPCIASFFHTRLPPVTPTLYTHIRQSGCRQCVGF